MLLYLALLFAPFPFLSYGHECTTNLQRHVAVLAADSLEGRGIGTDGLTKAERYVIDELLDLGVQLEPRDSFFASFHEKKGSAVANVLATFGTPSASPLIIAAHYDHLGVVLNDSTGAFEAYNGAHDNASGVSVVLEVARILAHEKAYPGVVCFAFFTAEELGMLGSRHYVAALRAPNDEVYACINIDAVGHLDAGAVLAAGLSGQPELEARIRDAFGAVDIPIENAARSYATGDQVPFLERGIPAVMLTTGPHPLMNTPADDAETLDYQGMERITAALVRLVHALEHERPRLDDPPKPEALPHSERTRRVRFGIMPDFTFEERGVRVYGVVPSSPAERAGLRAGDVVVTVAGDSLRGPRDLAQALSRYMPSDTVEVTILRDDDVVQTTAVLEGR